MLPLFDMLAKAQNGNAMEEMARQYGLSQAQAEQAIAALMPAFSQGLKRSASDPYGFGAFMSAMSTGQHARYFEDASAVFSRGGIEEGNGILGHLFGSKELSRAVAAQAAQATGIAETTLRQMLPALAAMIMGGLFKQSTGQLGAAPREPNPLQEMMEQMMRQTGTATGGVPRRGAPLTGASPFDNPFGRMFEEMMRAGQGSSAAGPAPEPPRERGNPSGRPRTPYDDLFGDMFEAGARQRDDYQKNMESIFDRFLKGMEKGQR